MCAWTQARPDRWRPWEIGSAFFSLWAECGHTRTCRHLFRASARRRPAAWLGSLLQAQKVFPSGQIRRVSEVGDSAQLSCRPSLPGSTLTGGPTGRQAGRRPCCATQTHMTEFQRQEEHTSKVDKDLRDYLRSLSPLSSAITPKPGI